MAQLSLKNRRGRARGYGAQNLKHWLGRKTLGDGRRSTLTTALAGSNNDITFTSKLPSVAGNGVTIVFAVAGNNTPLSVAVATKAITVNLATNGAAASISTADQVIREVNESRLSGPLVWAQRAPGNDGSGVVVALGSTALSTAT